MPSLHRAVPCIGRALVSCNKVSSLPSKQIWRLWPSGLACPTATCPSHPPPAPERAQPKIPPPLSLPFNADLEVVAKRFGVPYRHLPITPRDAASKAAQEAQIEQLLQVGALLEPVHCAVFTAAGQKLRLLERCMIHSTCMWTALHRCLLQASY